MNINDYTHQCVRHKSEFIPGIFTTSLAIGRYLGLFRSIQSHTRTHN